MLTLLLVSQLANNKTTVDWMGGTMTFDLWGISVLVSEQELEPVL